MSRQVQSKSTDSKWSFIIDGLIAIIPAAFVTVVLNEIGLRGMIVTIGPLFGFMYLSNLIRKKVRNNKNGTEELKISENKSGTQKAIVIPEVKTRTSRKTLIWILVVLMGFIFIGWLLSNLTEPQLDDALFLETDKNTEYSEVLGNMYRNSKYGFRIKFPEGWKIEPGDGLHIVQKATSGTNTVSVSIQQVDLQGAKGFSSIKDAGTAKEFIDLTLEGLHEKFPDINVIGFGETKVDNVPAYWAEYSGKAQILDLNIEMTNLMYFLAKKDTFYSISVGSASDEYEKTKPIFLRSVSTFVLEN